MVQGLGILKASLTSAFALINDLKHLIKTTKGENESITSVWSKFINKVFNSSHNFKVFRFLAVYHHCNCGCIVACVCNFLGHQRLQQQDRNQNLKLWLRNLGATKYTLTYIRAFLLLLCFVFGELCFIKYISLCFA